MFFEKNTNETKYFYGVQTGNEPSIGIKSLHGYAIILIDIVILLGILLFWDRLAKLAKHFFLDSGKLSSISKILKPLHNCHQNEKLKLYGYFFGLNIVFAILLFGLPLFSYSSFGTLYGSLLGGALACINPELNPVFLLGAIIIYFVFRRPSLTIPSIVVFSFCYQIYLRDYNRSWSLLGVSPPDLLSFPRIYGGVLVVSILGAAEYLFNAETRFGSSEKEGSNDKQGVNSIEDTVSQTSAIDEDKNIMVDLICFFKRHSLKVTYFLAIIIFILLFTDTESLLNGGMKYFSIDDSIIFGLIEGAGGRRLDYWNAKLLYWVCAFLYVIFFATKTKKISAWLWNHVTPPTT